MPPRRLAPPKSKFLSVIIFSAHVYCPARPDKPVRPDRHGPPRPAERDRKRAGRARTKHSARLRSYRRPPRSAALGAIAHRVPANRPFLASSNYSHVIFLAPHSMSIGNYTQPSSSVSREGFFKSLNRRNTSRIPPSVNQTVKITVAPNRMPRWIPHHSFHAVEETS